MSLFIEYPWLAAGIGVVFLVLYRLARRRVVLLAAMAWLGYGAYEMAMRLRWLCTGECNIRVDLLLIYPMLLVASVAAMVSWVRRRPG